MAENEQIGGISVGIVGDYSQLQQDLQAAQQIAQQAGQQIANAIEAGAAAADTSALAGALDKVEEAAHGAGAGIKDFDTQVSEAVASGHTLAEAIEIATKAMVEAGTAAGAAAAGLSEAGKAAEDAWQGFQTFSDAAQAVIDKQQGLEQAVTTAAGALQELYRGYEEGTVSAQTLARAQEELAQAVQKSGTAEKESTEGWHGLTDALMSTAKAAGVAFGAFELIKESLSAYAEDQRNAIALSALTGKSFEEAAEQMDKLRDVALQFAVAKDALESFNLRMTAFGANASQIVAAMRSVADAAGATGREFETAANSFERMVLGGMAGARQLVALGLSAKDLGAVMHVTAGEAAKAFKELDVSDRIEVLNAALKKYQGVAEQVATGILGQWQNLKSQIGFVLEDIGKLLAPLASQAMQFATILVEVFGALAKFRGDPVAAALGAHIENAIKSASNAQSEFNRTVTEYVPKAAAAKTATDALAEAYKQLGITSVADLTKQFNANVDAYNRVVQAYEHGRATMQDVDRALAAVAQSEERLTRATTVLATATQQFDILPMLQAFEDLQNLKFDSIVHGAEELDRAFVLADQSGKAFWERLNSFQDLHPALSKVVDDATAAARALDEAFQSVGKSNATVLKENLDNANKYLAAIRASGIATVKELEQADINAQQALIDYMRGTNQAVDQMWAASVQKRQEALNQELGQTKQHAEKVSLMWKEVAKDIDRAIEGFAGAISDVILRGEDLGASMKRVLTGIADDIIQLIVKGAIKNWMDALMGVQNQTQSVGQSIARMFGGGGGGVFPGGGGGGVPSGQAPLPSLEQLTGVMGEGGGGGAGGAGGFLGGAVPIAGVIAQIVQTVTEAISIAKVGKDVARIEVTTRGMLNELANSRKDAWDQFGQMFGRIGEIWSSVLGLSDSLRAWLASVAGPPGETAASILARNDAEVNARLNAEAEARRHGTEITAEEVAARSQYHLPSGVGTGAGGSAGVGLNYAGGQAGGGQYGGTARGGLDPQRMIESHQEINQPIGWGFLGNNGAKVYVYPPGSNNYPQTGGPGGSLVIAPGKWLIDATWWPMSVTEEQVRTHTTGQWWWDKGPTGTGTAGFTGLSPTSPGGWIPASETYPGFEMTAEQRAAMEASSAASRAAREAAAAADLQALQDYGARLRSAFTTGPLRDIGDYPDRVLRAYRLVNGELRILTDEVRGYVTSIDGIGVAFAQASAVGSIRDVTRPFEQLYETIRLVNGELARIPAGLGYVTSVNGIGRDFARANQLGTQQWDPASRSYVTRPSPTPMDRGVPWSAVYDPRNVAPTFPSLPELPEWTSPAIPVNTPMRPPREPIIVDVNLTGGDYSQQEAARLTANKIAEALRRDLGQRIN